MSLVVSPSPGTVERDNNLVLLMARDDQTIGLVGDEAMYSRSSRILYKIIYI